MIWLQQTVQTGEIGFYIVYFLALKFAYGSSICWIMKNLLKIKFEKTAIEEKENQTIAFLPLMFLGVFFEEVIFRLPLAFGINAHWPFYGILIFAAVLSTIFGFVHGGIKHIFVQGVGGIPYYILFLKCGGLEMHYNDAITVTTLTHFLFDLILFIRVMSIRNNLRPVVE